MGLAELDRDMKRIASVRANDGDVLAFIPASQIRYAGRVFISRKHIVYTRVARVANEDAATNYLNALTDAAMTAARKAGIRVACGYESGTPATGDLMVPKAAEATPDRALRRLRVTVIPTSAVPPSATEMLTFCFHLLAGCDAVAP